MKKMMVMCSVVSAFLFGGRAQAGYWDPTLTSPGAYLTTDSGQTVTYLNTQVYNRQQDPAGGNLPYQANATFTWTWVPDPNLPPGADPPVNNKNFIHYFQIDLGGIAVSKNGAAGAKAEADFGPNNIILVANTYGGPSNVTPPAASQTQNVANNIGIINGSTLSVTVNVSANSYSECYVNTAGSWGKAEFNGIRIRSTSVAIAP